MTKSKISLQDTFLRLEKILEKLESSNFDIDEMLELYEEGVLLSRQCKKELEEAKQKIEIINSNDATAKDLEL
tara:strand:- start:142 stop:360 length:219 start_codon:yes stop_codon:yes gene_type:complete